jgi:hypothetical protein
MNCVSFRLGSLYTKRDPHPALARCGDPVASSGVCGLRPGETVGARVIRRFPRSYLDDDHGEPGNPRQ